MCGDVAKVDWYVIAFSRLMSLDVSVVKYDIRTFASL